MRLLLLSNGSVPGRRYLEHALPVLGQLLRDVSRVAFLPYAQLDLDRHTEVIAAALAPLGVEVLGVHRGQDPRAVIESADAVSVGGGNAFRLLAALHHYGILEAIRSAVQDGAPYVGSSAGTNMACPTLRTTNDMPIVQPPAFTALGLVPFQINPHYPADEVMGSHLGETRDRRIAQFLEENDVPVIGLQEGSWLHVAEGTIRLGGVAGARLFRRDAEPVDLSADADLSFLMSTRPIFDTRAAAGRD